jgi:hypothetical protein
MSTPGRSLLSPQPIWQAFALLGEKMQMHVDYVLRRCDFVIASFMIDVHTMMSCFQLWLAGIAVEGGQFIAISRGWNTNFAGDSVIRSVVQESTEIGVTLFDWILIRIRRLISARSRTYLSGMPNGVQTGDPCVRLTFPRTGLAGEDSVGRRIVYDSIQDHPN